MKSTNLKFVFVFLLSIVMVLSVAACGGASAAATESAAATDASAAATTAPAASGDVVAAYKFTNTGTVEICELYLSPAGTTDWGPDQLKKETIAAGAEFTLTDIPAGKYDAKVVGCNGAGEKELSLDIHN